MADLYLSISHPRMGDFLLSILGGIKDEETVVNYWNDLASVSWLQ